MAVIAAVTARGKPAEFTIVPTALTGTDSLVYKPSAVQTLYLENTAGAPVTITIDGDAVTTVALPGQGKAINNAAGYAIVVAAGALVAITLGTIRNFLAGNVAVTGGVATTKAWIVES